MVRIDKDEMPQWMTTAQCSEIIECTPVTFRARARRLGLRPEMRKNGRGNVFFWDIHRFGDLCIDCEWVDSFIGSRLAGVSSSKLSRGAGKLKIRRRVAGKNNDGGPKYEYLRSDIISNLAACAGKCSTVGCDNEPDKQLFIRGKHYCRACACPDIPITDDDREAAITTGYSPLGGIAHEKSEKFGRDKFHDGLDRYLAKQGVKIKRSSRGPIIERS